MNILTQKDIDRFWGKVDKEKSTNFYNGTRCWEWTASCYPSGYGQMWFVWRMEGTHRIAWRIANGEIPESIYVLHHCDNCLCVNPSHLFLGTHQDNMIDMAKKGRCGQPRGDKSWVRLHPEKVSRGENNGRAKLTHEQIAEIRANYAWQGDGGDSAPVLAKRFGVDVTQIYRIVKNKNWKNS